MSSSPEQPSRPLAGTESSWHLAVPGGTGVSVLTILLAAPPPSLAALTETLNAVVARHSILTAELRSPKSLPPFFSFPSSPSPLAISVGEPQTFSSMAEIAEFEMNSNPWASSPESAPVLFASLHTFLSRQVLCLKIHTAACDRVGVGRLFKELTAVAAAPEEDVAAVAAGIEGMIAKKDSAKPFWARGMDLVGYSLNGFRTATLPFSAGGGAPDRSEMLRFRLDPPATKKLLDECKGRGVKLCGAMAAATLLAARRSKPLAVGQQESYSVVTLINSRKFLDPPLDEHNIGFFHSAVTNVHSITGEEGVWEVAKRCHGSYSGAIGSKKHLTDIGDLNFLMCRAIENPQLTPSGSLRTGVVSVFEEPVILDSPHSGGLAVEDCLIAASVHGIGPSIGIIDAIRDGALDCVWAYPSPLHSRAQMEGILEQAKSILLAGSE